MDNICRKRVAKYSLIFGILFPIIFILTVMATPFICTYGGCLSLVFVIVILLVISVAAISTSLINFIYQLYCHKWKGLIFWEKSVLYTSVLYSISILELSPYVLRFVSSF